MLDILSEDMQAGAEDYRGFALVMSEMALGSGNTQVADAQDRPIHC